YDTILKTVTGGSPTSIPVGEKSSHPTHITLLQNYPNPFNARTYIRFQLYSEDLVSLKIYNLLGKEVETLIKENRPAGQYEIVWDAGDLSSGIYLYQLIIGDYRETKKLILQK
ncbi:MAG: T9SS type A sorting domain-containing protein, partial [bacterium]